MKKLLILFLASLFVLAACPGKIPGVQAAGTDIAIDETVFPDPVFRREVRERCDTDRNGRLSAAEISNVTSLYVPGLGIASMQGVGVFTNLQYLGVTDTDITTLDLTQNTELLLLYASGTALTSLDLSRNTKLGVLWVNNTQIPSLDLSHQTKLRSLNISDTVFTSVDLSHNTQLTTLFMNNSVMTSIDLSGNPRLTHLKASDAKLKTLDLTWNTKLQVLRVDGSDLTSLDLGANPDLRTLATEKSRILALNLSPCPALADLYYNHDPDHSYVRPYTYDHTELRDYLYLSKGYADYLSYDKGTVIHCAPLITEHPESTLKAVGETASFQVAATAALNYQWWYRKSASDPWTKVTKNGTSPVYSVTVAARHNGYRYRCRVSNADGGVWSSTATLTSPVKPAVTSQPVGTSVRAGQTATFRVSASGGALRYQWWYRKSASGTWTKVTKNGTDSVYTLVTEARHNGYQYRCRVSNPAGGIWSRTVTLTVRGH